MHFPISSKNNPESLLGRYPKALGVFVKLRLKCFGCPLAHIHTLSDVAREYDLDLEQFIDLLHREIEGATIEAKPTEKCPGKKEKQ